MDEPPPIDPEEPAEELLERITPELQPGERLIWAAREQRREADAASRPFPILSLLCAGTLLAAGMLLLAAFWGAFGRRFPREEGLLLTLAIGTLTLGSMLTFGSAGRWLAPDHRPSAHGRRDYALTDRRAIIWSPRADSEAVEVFSFPRGKIHHLHRVEYPDGSGDVIFGMSDEGWGPSSLEGISKVRHVEELVRKYLGAPDTEGA